MKEFKLHHGDCLEVLRTITANSVDAIVTDPPYGLSFMGKKWDYDVPAVEVWAECLRVLKPGGHLLAFAGTRTQHRMAVRIEDAGFEIRDMIAWVYGSGFPKSLDVSKAIDKMDAAEEQKRRRLAFAAWVRSQGVTSRQIDEATGTNMGDHYTTAASQPAIMTREHLEACRHLFRDVPEWVEREADQRTVESENFKRREVVGSEIRYNEASGIVSAGRDERTLIERKITAPATDAAHQWQGWGTALKPALEPITVARKPLVGTVAENVLAHGTGALNIDGCRIEGRERTDYGLANSTRSAGNTYGEPSASADFDASKGRWPANLIHDGSDEVVAGFPKADGRNPLGVKVNTASIGKATTAGIYGEALYEIEGKPGYANTGSAARFFYCAKASKRDRDEGLEGFPTTVQQSVAHGERQYGTLPYTGEQRKINPRQRANIHPTVKPTDLMRYLCRLVTPPGGTVLDCYTGSGSTGKAAILEGFNFIGIEREAEYLEIASARIQSAITGYRDPYTQSLF